MDYADDINNPDWKNVFKQIAEAGYSYCEIGPYGFLPKDFQETQNFLNDFDLNVVGGFIFDLVVLTTIGGLVLGLTVGGIAIIYAALVICIGFWR